MNFFGLEMTLPPPFLDIFPKFTTKIYCFEYKKICNEIFWIENYPLPLDFFPKISKSEITGAPMRGVLKKGESATWEKFSYKYVQIITTTFIFDKVFCLKVKCCQICILFTQ